MAFITRSKSLHWTHHAQAKMRFYKLSEQRVRQVLHSPKRIEEGVAPKTIAMMQPASVKSVMGQASGRREETWTQEIWVMIQKVGQRSKVNGQKSEITKVISAWRYPGRTKPKSEAIANFIKQEYNAHINKTNK